MLEKTLTKGLLVQRLMMGYVHVHNLTVTKVAFILAGGTNFLHNMKLTGMLTGHNFEKMLPQNTSALKEKFKSKCLKCYASFSTPACTG